MATKSVTKRTYPEQEWCPVARTLDVVGDRWTLLIIRDIFRRQRKFSQLLESLPGLSPNLLADRLKRLEERGILERRFYSDHPPRAEYWFTPKGLAFGKVVSAMKAWGEEWEPE
ncbi:MAG: helix-turn-helix domain-containing protein [Chloroflexota bacterium]